MGGSSPTPTRLRRTANAWLSLAALGLGACSIYSEDMDRTSGAVLPAPTGDTSANDESSGGSGSLAPSGSSSPDANSSGAPSDGDSSGSSTPGASDDSGEGDSRTDDSSAPGATGGADAGSDTATAESSEGTGTSERPTDTEDTSEGTDGSTNGAVPPPVAPKPDYLIDDFEDTDPALPRIGKRIGYWFTECSDDGTITPIDEVFVKPQDSGALYVAHVQANGFDEVGSWAAFGVNLNDGSAYPDGAKYIGLRFYARAGEALTTVRVEVRTTENDLPRGDGGALLNDDTYGRVLEIGPEWKLYYVQWADSTFQQQGWGDAFDFEPEHMTSISFKLAPQETNFDLLLDDIEFIER